MKKLELSAIVDAVMVGERIALVHGVNANVRGDIIYPLIKEALSLSMSVLVVAPCVRVLREVEAASEGVPSGVLSVINALSSEGVRLKNVDYNMYHVIIVVDAHCVSCDFLHDIKGSECQRVLTTGLAIGWIPWTMLDCYGIPLREIRVPTPCEKLKATYGEDSDNYRSFALAEWR